MTTAFYAALLALIYVGLAANVIMSRVKYEVPLLDGGIHAMSRAIRAHSNFAEYVPFFLVLLFLTEYSSFSRYIIHLIGILFVAGRLVHAYSLLYGERYENGKLVAGLPFRQFGTSVTLASLVGLALILLYQYLFKFLYLS